MITRNLVRCGFIVWLALVAGLSSASGHGGDKAAPDAANFDERQALAYSQAAIGRQVGDYRFIAADGRTVDLSQYRGKPLVISLIYTSCYHICPLITQALMRSVKAAENALGHDKFAVVTIGFDAAVDTPGRMRTYGREHGVDKPYWTLLSGDPATIDSLSRDVGFFFYPSPKGYDHLAQTTILNEEGRVAAQVYGDSFEPPVVIEPLKAVIFGRHAQLNSLNGILNKVRLICTIYDPKSERYHFDYSLLVGIIVGGLCLGLVAVVLVREAWRLRQYTKNKRDPGST